MPSFPPRDDLFKDRLNAHQSAIVRMVAVVSCGATMERMEWLKKNIAHPKSFVALVIAILIAGLVRLKDMQWTKEMASCQGRHSMMTDARRSCRASSKGGSLVTSKRARVAGETPKLRPATLPPNATRPGPMARASPFQNLVQ